MDRIKQAAFYLEVDLVDRLDKYTGDTGRSKSEVVREALDRYLSDRNG